MSNLIYFPIRLQQLFGENPEFNEDMALAMKLKMIEELGKGEKREYMSAPGKEKKNTVTWHSVPLVFLT